MLIKLSESSTCHYVVEIYVISGTKNFLMAEIKRILLVTLVWQMMGFVSSWRTLFQPYTFDIELERHCLRVPSTNLSTRNEANSARKRVKHRVLCPLGQVRLWDENLLFDNLNTYGSQTLVEYKIEPWFLQTLGSFVQIKAGRNHHGGRN